MKWMIDLRKLKLQQKQIKVKHMLIKIISKQVEKGKNLHQNQNIKTE